MLAMMCCGYGESMQHTHTHTQPFTIKVWPVRTTRRPLATLPNAMAWLSRDGPHPRRAATRAVPAAVGHGCLAARAQGESERWRWSHCSLGSPPGRARRVRLLRRVRFGLRRHLLRPRDRYAPRVRTLGREAHGCCFRCRLPAQFARAPTSAISAGSPWTFFESYDLQRFELRDPRSHTWPLLRQVWGGCVCMRVRFCCVW